MPSDHFFFTSYARLDNRDGELAKVVGRIRDRVVAKVGEDVSIFFDTSNITNGVDWEKALGAALRETRLIVCLCSPAYFKSRFCAKEFEVFRRRVNDEKGASVAIFPVVWEPGSLPESVSRFHQPQDPRFPQDYYAAGLYQLSRLKSQEEALLQAIEALATDIERGDKDSKAPIWGESVKFDDLPDFFHNPAREPYGVAVAVLHEHGSQWKPGHVRSSVGALVDAVAQSLRVAWQDLPGRPLDLPAHLNGMAQARQGSILVVGHADLDRSPWQETLQSLQAGAHENLALLIGCEATELPPTTDSSAALRERFAGLRANTFALDDEEAFKAAVTKTITTLRLAMIQADAAAKVIAPELRDSAIQAGVPVDAIATLTGPGG